MTISEISDFIAYEHVDRSGRLQKVAMQNQVGFIGRILAADQKEELKQENKWVFRHASGDLIVLNGDDIISIKIS